MSKFANQAVIQKEIKVPARDGGFIPANPVKFCLKYKPPTIAIVYLLHNDPKKYLHEFPVSIKENSDLNKICDELFAIGQPYLDSSKLQRQQILELLTKLQRELFKGSQQQQQQNKENNANQQHKQQEEAENKPQRKQNFLEKKRFVDYAELDQNFQSKDKEQKKGNVLDDFDDSDDDENDPWTHKPQKDQKQNQDKKPSVVENKKPNPFEDDIKPAFDDLDFDFEKKNVQQPKQELKYEQKENKGRQYTEDNGLFVDDDFAHDLDDMEEDDKSDQDIFNNSRSKENKQSSQITETNPQEKQELKQNQQKSEINASGNLLPPDTEEDEEEGEEDQEKAINEQFKMIYDGDAELRQLLNNDISNLGIQDKYQILQAYVQGGGIQGLIQQEAENEVAVDPKMIEQEFNTIYQSDEKLRELLGNISALKLEDKYQILEAYKKGGGVQGLIEEEEEEESVIEHNGMKFKRVQIEGENQDYFMDDKGNIYDTEFNYIGQANGSDEEN